MGQRPGKLVVLDDDAIVARTLGFIAEGAGFEVHCVDAPKAFFDAVRDLDPTHVAIDLIMPGMDGVEVIRRLASTGCAAAVILTSGMGQKVLESAQATAEGRGLNIVGVLPKPFKPAALRALLARVGSPPSAAAGASRLPSHERVARAITEQAITIVAQPKVELATGAVVGAEVLARWHDPELGVVGPDQFVAVAESHGLAQQLCMHILHSALAWYARSPLRERGGSLAVNLSTTCLSEVTLADQIHAACAASGVPPSRLVLEITESTAMDRTADSFDTLTRLRLKGFHLSVDDFGTGYSSLAQLARLPLSEIKIDRSFVLHLLTNDDARKIVDATIRLGRSMGLVSVAEGVEDLAVMQELRALGCDLAQGYFISRPLAVTDFDAWLGARD